jgi:hypothetical protein
MIFLVVPDDQILDYMRYLSKQIEAIVDAESFLEKYKTWRRV